MRRYSIETRTRKYVKGYGFLSFARKYEKQLWNTGLDASKKVAQKTSEFLQTKIAEDLSKTLAMRTKSNDDNIEKEELVEEIIIPPENIEET